jgi:serine/threonine-protein kinase
VLPPHPEATEPSEATASLAVAWVARLLAADLSQRDALWQQLALQPAALQAEVRQLHQLSQRSTDALLAGLGSAIAPLPTLCAGEHIGARRLVRHLGTGGMAQVWLAEREAPPQRLEALKFPDRPMNAVEWQRFEREAQVLARLDLTGVARLHDVGVLGTPGAPGARPYLVMEYVVGQVITEGLDARRLDVRARVEVFLQLVQVVEQVHRHMVVHRDIKPSNVLLDGSGQVRLLDFGIAKLLDAQGHPQDTPTLAADRLLTAAYAAPEQILGVAVSAATDVHALGLLLAELLAGRTARMPLPSTADGLRRLLQHAVEDEPPPLAALLPTGPDALQALAEARSTTGPALRRALQGDLAVIVAKALRLDPAQRYPTAAALADDVQRWLDQRPILARAPSLRYRLACFIDRHRVAVAAGALAALGLAGSAGLAWHQYQDASDQRAWGRAMEAVGNSVLSVIDPDIAGAHQVTSVELIDRASAAIAADAAIGPADQRRLAVRLGELYEQAGAHAKATAVYAAELQAARRAREPLAEARANLLLADVAMLRGDTDLADQYLRATQPPGPTPGPDWRHLMARRDLLAGERLSDLRQYAAADSVLAPAQAVLDQWASADLVWRARAARVRGANARMWGRLDLARAQLARAAALYGERGGPGQLHQLSVRLDLVALDNWAGRHAAALQALPELCEALHQRLGRGHVRSLVCATETAMAQLRLGQFDAAAQTLARLQPELIRTDGVRRLHAEAARGLAVRLAMYRGEPEAETQLRTLLQEADAGAPTRSAEVLRRLLGELLLRQGRDAEAVPVLQQTARRQTEMAGADHPSVAATQLLLAIAAARAGRLDEADQQWRTAEPVLLRTLGADHPATLATQAYLALVHPVPEAQRPALVGAVQAALGWQPGAKTVMEVVFRGRPFANWPNLPVLH